MRIEIRRLDPSVPLPAYARPHDAGMDLVSAEGVTLKPGERAALSTGIAIAIEEGYAGFVLPRSGRALGEGLTVANSPGLIDSGYRGEVKVLLVNLDPNDPVHVERGDKIAQLVVQAVEVVDLEVVSELPTSERGGGGLGSTGR